MRRDCFYFCPPFRVRYGEVDQQGIVYNGNYVAYTDLAFEEFLRSKGYSYRELAEKHDSEVCHKKSTYEFVSSAYAGDMLEVGISKIKIGKKSFTTVSYTHLHRRYLGRCSAAVFPDEVRHQGADRRVPDPDLSVQAPRCICNHGGGRWF